MQETTETNCSHMNFLQFDNAAACCLVFRANARGGGDFISQRQRWRGVLSLRKAKQ